jgi:uncharacterized protein (DUF362 family)
MNSKKEHMHHSNEGRHSHIHKHSFCFLLTLGFSSLIWFIFRTGTKPSRIVYPCQQLAIMNSIAFLPGTAAALLWRNHLIKKFKKYSFLPWLIVVGILMLIPVLDHELSEQRSLAKMIPHQPVGMPSGINPGRVVWVHDATATTGHYDQYWTQVDQVKVDNMMEVSLKALAGERSGPAAVAKLFPCGAKCTGKKIAIKVNMNNVESSNSLDANSQVVIALLKRLTQAQRGVFAPFNQSDITIFDASRDMRRPFGDSVRAAFPRVKLVNIGNVQMSNETFAFEHVCKPSTSVTVPQLLKDADYIINMPLLKEHDDTNGATLTFKNLFGMSNNPLALHACLTSSGNKDGLTAVYTASFTNNDGSATSISQKTKLIVGDGIFGDFTHNGQSITNWSIFGNHSPNSLFLSQDPVAVDSVMYDVIMAQRGSFNNAGQQHLEAAAQRSAGSLGVHEHPGLDTACTDKNDISCWTYTKIDYVVCDISGNKLNPLCGSKGTTLAH